MKKVLIYSGLLLTTAFAACGGGNDPEQEKRYTDSVATARYDERMTWMKDSLSQSCEEGVKQMQDEIDELNEQLAKKKK